MWHGNICQSHQRRNRDKYKFVFTKGNPFGKTTYEYEIEAFRRTQDEMLNKACALIDFGIFDDFSMYDEHGFCLSKSSMNTDKEESE